MLNRAYWGVGYMFEALSALLSYLWSGEVGLVEILTADADPRNDASIGLLTKMGFRQTGFRERTFETQIGWCDSVYFALENPWNAAHTEHRSTLLCSR